MENRLYRDKGKAILGGVAAGIAEQLKLDINLIRAIFIVLVLFGKIGIAASFVVYCVLWICLPALQNASLNNAETDGRFVADYKVDPLSSESKSNDPINTRNNTKGNDSSTLLGFILVGLGAILLADRFFEIDWNFLDRFWPLALVAAGVLIVFKSRK